MCNIACIANSMAELLAIEKVSGSGKSNNKSNDNKWTLTEGNAIAFATLAMPVEAKANKPQLLG